MKYHLEGKDPLMPGQGRKQPPPGYMTPTDAAKLLGANMLYKYVRAGKLTRFKPETREKHGFYKISEVEALAGAEQRFYGVGTPAIDAVFDQATSQDIDGLVTLAKRLFARTIGAERRREWLAREPRGNYVLRRKDGSIAAYAYFQPLQHDRLIAYQRGQIKGWEITADDIEPFAPGAPREVMIGGIGTDPDVDARTRGNYAAVLLRGIAQDMARLGQAGMVISTLYAYSSTIDGIVMCLDLDMQRFEPPRNKRCTFILDMDAATHWIFQHYKKALAEWQRTHQEQQER
jgi:hypothetical protein